MIYWLYEYRELFSSEEGLLYKVLNIFKYHTFRAGGAALTAFVFSLLFGDRLIRKLISLKIGQPIRSADENVVLIRMALDHIESSGEGAWSNRRDSVHDTLGGDFGQFRAHVAGHRDEVGSFL
jgi:hypothetical protein